MRYIILISVLFSVLFCHEYGFSRSWDDLDDGESIIYGREKEEKYSIKTIVVEKEEWQDHYSLMIFWLYKYTDYPKYKSMRALPFYYGLDSKIDNRSMTLLPLLLSYFETDGDAKKSYILCPLYYSSTSTDMSDRSLLFLIWWGKEKYNYTIDSYQTIFPVFYHSSITNAEHGYGKYLWVNPLFVSYKETASMSDNKDHVWWAPIIPLTFHSTDEYGGHRNIFWILDYSWDRQDGSDSLKRFWFFPFYLWKSGDDGYTSILPPIYINNRHSNGDYYYHILPVFVTWKSEESQGRIIFPLYLQYKDDHRDIYVNGLGIAKSAYMGPFSPSVSADLTNKDNNWYLDSEVSWFYEIFSLSNRISIKNPFGAKDNSRSISHEVETSFEAEISSKKQNVDSNEPPQKTGLTSGVDRKGRENSEFFWGWKILFGWIAYEKADSQKHVRFLPLTWLTWNEKSEDKVYVFLPFFVSYLSEETKTEYFVVFPFYLMQRQNQSYFKLYLINLYIDEYNASEDCYDKSILWPIINWYSSPDKNGFRIFPFFWSKNQNDGSHSSMLLPFYRWDSEPDSKSLIIFPALSYFSEDQYGNTKFIAGTYWYRSPDYERTNFLYLYDHKKNNRSDQYSFLFTTIEFDFGENYTEMRMLWGLLLEYESDKKYGSYDIDAFLWLAGVGSRRDYFHNRILPVYWYTRAGDSSYLVLPPVLSLFSGDRNGNFDLGILGILYYRNEDRYRFTDRRMWLLGALYNEVKYPERSYHSRGSLWGILWDYETEDEGSYKRFTILKGLYKYINNNGKTEHTLFWVF